MATAVRVELNQQTDELYLVFKIVDEAFRQEVKRDWTQDLEVKLLGKDLVIC